MADPLSMASAVAGLISLADIVLTKTFRYVRAVQSAEKNIKDLLKQLESMYGTMNVLKTRLRVLDDALTPSALPFPSPDIMLDCTQLLDEINQRLSHYQTKEGNSKRQAIQQTMRHLRWPFEASQTRELVERLGSFNQVLLTALQGDTLSAVYETFRTANQIRDDIQKLDRSLSIKMHSLAAIELNKAQEEAFNYFNRCDPRSRHDVAKKLCQRGTGKWFTEGEAFTSWLKGGCSKLWLSGIPGAGKTILASSIIEKARYQAAKSGGSSAVAYFYCDYNDPRTQEANNILSTIAAQLARQHEDAMNVLLQEYVKFYKPGRAVSYDESKSSIDLVQLMCAYYDRTFIIVDGLDECGQNMNEVTVELCRIADTDGMDDPEVACVFLSRNEHDIRRVLLPEYYEIEIAAQSYDLKLFVLSQLERLDIDDPEFKNKISDTLVNKAEGMFRWVACQIDHLSELASIEDCEQALQELPPDLNSSYDKILERVNKKPPAIQNLVSLTLKWLILAKFNRLTITALREALTIRLGQTKFSKGQMPVEQAILRNCSSFVRKSADGECLEPAHFTVAEYLAQISSSTDSLAQYRIDSRRDTALLGKLCLTYLNFQDFGEIEKVTQVKQRASAYRFRDHAVHVWAAYARENLDDESCLDLCREFFSEAKSVNRLTWLHDLLWKIYAKQMDPLDIAKDSDDGQILEERLNWTRYLKGVQPLHCASFAQLPQMVKYLCDQGADVNRKSALGTPIQCAILGREVIYKSVSSLDVSGRHDFRHIIRPATFSTLKALIEAGAKPTKEWQPPDQKDSIPTLRLLFPDHSTIDPTGEEYGPQRQCITLLLNAGLRIDRRAFQSIDLDARGSEFPKDLIKLEHIEEDCRVEWLDATRQLALEPSTGFPQDTLKQAMLHAQLRYAAQHDQVTMLEALMAQESIDINATDDRGQTALCIAVAGCSLNAVKFLSVHGADIGHRDKIGWTIFHYAVETHDAELIRLVFSLGSPEKTDTGATLSVWYYAGLYGEIAALELLWATFHGNEEACSDLHAEEQSALSGAISNGRDEAVLFLTNSPYSMTSWNKHGRLLVRCGEKLKPQTMRELIRRGLDCTHRDEKDATALHILCRTRTVDKNALEVAKILLDGGCTADDKCSSGDTPLQLLLEQMANYDPDFSDTEDLLFDTTSESLSDAEAAILQLLATQTSLTISNELGYSALDSLLSHNWAETRKFVAIFDDLASRGARFASQESCSSLFYQMVDSDIDHSEIFTKLLEYSSKKEVLGLSSEIVDAIGIWAAQRPNTKLLGVALDAEVDLLKRDDKVSNKNILECVCSFKHKKDVVARIFQRLSDQQLKQACVGDDNLVHMVCHEDSTADDFVLQMLLDRGLDINTPHSDYGHSPLQLAAIAKKPQLFRCLLEAGANLQHRTMGRWNVVHYAVENDPAIVAILAERCMDAVLWLAKVPVIFPFHDRQVVEDDCSILHIASHSSDTTIISFILEKWPQLDIDQRTRRDATPLHIACQTGCEEVVRFLLERGASRDVLDVDQNSPLHYAAGSGTPDIVRDLCEAKLDINAINNSGRTPLHQAAYGGNLSNVYVLLQKGARSICDNSGLTPELAALSEGHTRIAVTIKEHMKGDAGTLLLKQREGVIFKQFDVFRSLIIATINGDIKVAEHQATILSCTDDPPCAGCTPISTALRANRVELVKFLIDHGYSVRSPSCLCHGDRATPLKIVAKNPDFEAVLPLVLSQHHPQDSGRITSTGFHPALVAAAGGQLSNLKTILHHFLEVKNPPISAIESIISADPLDVGEYNPIEIYDYDTLVGANLMQIAVARSRIEIVRYLLKYPTLVNAVDSLFASPLHFAAACNAVEIIDVLLDAGADIEARTAWGNTPLFVAAWHSSRSSVEKLIERGAQVKISNVQPAALSAVLSWKFCHPAILARLPHVPDVPGFDLTFNSFTENLSSICFTSDLLTSKFTNARWALGHHILFNGKQRLKLILKWLKLNNILQQQLEYQPPSALCLAAQFGDPEIVNTLIDFGADIDVVGCDEGTALTLACSINRLAVVKCLVRRGASLWYTDDEGKPMSCVEKAAKHPIIVDWLLVQRWTEQRRLPDPKIRTGLQAETFASEQDVKPWSGFRTVESPLPPEYKQFDGETLLEWHIRKRREIKEFEGNVLHHGGDIVFPFINYD